MSGPSKRRSVCFGVALVLFLASIAGFVHAFTRGKNETVT